MKIRFPYLPPWLSTRPNAANSGAWAEHEACRYLRKQGLKLIQRNFSCQRGEIDLIMMHRDTLVFVEVRFRRADDYGHAMDTVDWRKQRRLRTTAEYFLLQHKRLINKNTRFDVVALQGERGSTEISWIKAAF